MTNPSAPANGTSLDEAELLAILEAKRSRLFAILDACDTPQVLEKLATLPSSQWSSLYLGEAMQKYEAIAPYLVKLDSATLEWIQSELWDLPWGIFVIAIPDATLEDLRRHFRQFLMVQDPDGNPMYFRFYDPRVIPLFPKAGIAASPVESILCGWALGYHRLDASR